LSASFQPSNVLLALDWMVEHRNRRKAHDRAVAGGMRIS
jgi:hypothetical protein